MKRLLKKLSLTVTAGVAVYVLGSLLLTGGVSGLAAIGEHGDSSTVRTMQLVSEGRNVFRFDTFGDQAVWGGVLGLQKAIEGAKLGGVGPGVSPKTALALGLKVDSTMIPPKVAAAIKAGKVNLDDPAVTLTLLKLDAVVGVKGFFNRHGTLRSVGSRAPSATPRSTIPSLRASATGSTAGRTRT